MKRADARGNVVGVDPHRHTLSATMVDERGGIVATGHYKVSGDGHRALEAWALSFGPVARWGIEGASGLGRHASMYLCRQGHDVRDVNPTRTAERARGRFQGKSDVLDSERIARETLAHPELPVAFKRAGDDSGPDETIELIGLWHKRDARCSRRGSTSSTRRTRSSASCLTSCAAPSPRPRQSGRAWSHCAGVIAAPGQLPLPCAFACWPSMVTPSSSLTAGTVRSPVSWPP
ncbi:MAG TPA: hypothetical protein DCX12_00945 [Chloroflexi bacterium]|nr:hypothetical protein [Chloroflexota bacterium]